MILPVKPPAIGKSRLTGLSDEARRALAGAFALDTAQAALRTRGVAGVLAVTDDFRFATQLRAQGCAVIPDGTTQDLNAALTQAAVEVARRWPDTTPVVVCADLPCLRPDELAEVLAALPEGDQAFVRDSAGTGTTVYAAPPDLFVPCFGPGSARAHRAGGAAEIVVRVPSVRHDVDDMDDLAAARLLGVGTHTAAVLDDLG